MDRDLLLVGFRAAHAATQANLSGLTEEEAGRPVGLGGNSVNWIAGHLLSIRDRVLPRLGGSPFLRPDEGALYGTGTSPAPAGGPSVALARLEEGLAATGRGLIERFTRLTPAELDQAVDPRSIRVPVERPTLGAQLSFFVFHEGYHSGQLGIARRALGRSSGLGF